MDQKSASKVASAPARKRTQRKQPKEAASSAEWMAVHHANRAVTVAWVSAIVNLLVVIVALATPLFQRQIDRQKEIEAQYESKSALVGEAIKIYLDGVQSKTSLGIILDPEYNLGAAMDSKTRIEIIDEMDLSLANVLEENRFLFSQPNKDINYGNFVSALTQRINHLRYAARRTKYIIEHKDATGTAALRAAQGQFDEQYEQDLALIRLLIHLNYDSVGQKTKSGGVDYSDCDDPKWKVFCETPNSAVIR